MRTKMIINGFKNSQKFRFILTATDGANFGMTITIQQMSDQFATTEARRAVWDAMEKLARDRKTAQLKNDPVPIGLVTDAVGFRQVQVDLH